MALTFERIIVKKPLGWRKKKFSILSWEIETIGKVSPKNETAKSSNKCVNFINVASDPIIPK